MILGIQYSSYLKIVKFVNFYLDIGKNVEGGLQPL
jgi:hypothetical protein